MLFWVPVFLLLSINANLVLFSKTVFVPSSKKIEHVPLRSKSSNGRPRFERRKRCFLRNGLITVFNRRKGYLKGDEEKESSAPRNGSTVSGDTDERKIDDSNLICFDDYFNKESPQNYTKLEAEKLKIIKESIQSNKKEMREIMAKSYKNDYLKLLKEEEEDAQLSDKVYESLKITFHMNENINNILFTQYSNMISKLKEQSTILKNLRTLYGTDKKRIESAASSAAPPPDERTESKKGETTGEGEQVRSAQVEPRLEPSTGNLFERLQTSSNRQTVDDITKGVHFFKPENYTNLQKTRTFSDKMFANVEVKSSSAMDLCEEKGETTTEDEEYDTEDMEQPILLQDASTPLQMLKEDVKSCLCYKTDNIIKNNLSVDHLHGRVKVHWFPKFMRRTVERIPDFIKMSDIIIEVRNSIIPFVFDDLYALNIFNFVTNKPKIIVYTRSDISSEKGNEEWGHYYRRKLYWADKHFNRNIDREYENQMKKSAVIFVDAKNGGKEIIVLKKLINRLCKHVIEKKKRKGISNYKIKCIFLGLPNVGKSALINRLLNLRKTKSCDSPGVTKVIQMYSSPKYELIDTPGLLADNLYKIREKEYNKDNQILESIYNYDATDYSQNNIVNIKNYSNYMHIENNIYLLALCNHISAQSYDIYNVAEVLIQNMYNSYLYNNDYIDLKKMIKRYQINFTECLNNDGMFSAFHFIRRLARDKFQNDLNQASMRLVSDFRKNYLGKITLNYPLYFNKKKITLKMSRKFVQQKSDKYVGW